MLWIPPGTFMMGSPLDEIGRSYEDGDPFLVTLSQGFWLSKFLVDTSSMECCNGFKSEFLDQVSADCPVENITWDEAMQFCEVLK